MTNGFCAKNLHKKLKVNYMLHCKKNRNLHLLTRKITTFAPSKKGTHEKTELWC